jgi:truncated hemoglobin YjbI
MQQQQQQQHQDEFMADAVVGIERWNGSHVRIAHKKVVAKPDLTDIHFDAITEDSIAT